MPNLLNAETSPYLLQHADNPVDWHPWGQVALQRARAENKPILLSIGYAACHWCHVMAHECFEDEVIAQILNRNFVCIKVDREERPDLDQIYQETHQMLTRRSGGWPLTVFMGPEQIPFFSGTYFPKTPKHGLPGFGDLLIRIVEFHAANPQEIQKQNQVLLQAFQQSLPRAQPGLELTAAPIDRARGELQQNFDGEFAGFGSAPKFPHPTELQLCLRLYASRQDNVALNMTMASLQHMVAGGIYDQLAGGFFRYSVDRQWQIPHFEKMLYDNGPLLGLLADAWCISQDPLLRQAVTATAEWAIRDMQMAAGGFYATLDADSEGKEGKFYVWAAEEVARHLQSDEYALAAQFFQLQQPPNFEDKFWHLQGSLTLPETASLQQLATCRSKLLAVRNQRIPPARDEKILTSWNGLMIKGLVHAAKVLQEPAWYEAAVRAVAFIREHLWRDGRLLAVSTQGKANLPAYLDDYAFLLDGLLEMLSHTYDAKILGFAREIADVLLEQFEDAEAGGFYFTSHDHETLIHRNKPAHDAATPSGNGIAAQAMQRLGHLCGEPAYLRAAERTLHLFAPLYSGHPAGCSALLLALQEYLQPPRILVLRGPADELTTWQQQLHALYLPDTLVLALPNEISDLPATLSKPATATVNAWVCQGVSCLPPITDWTELLAACQT